MLKELIQIPPGSHSRTKAVVHTGHIGYTFQIEMRYLWITPPDFSCADQRLESGALAYRKPARINKMVGTAAVRRSERAAKDSTGRPPGF